MARGTHGRTKEKKDPEEEGKEAVGADDRKPNRLASAHWPRSRMKWQENTLRRWELPAKIPLQRYFKQTTTLWDRLVRRRRNYPPFGCLYFQQQFSVCHSKPNYPPPTQGEGRGKAKI
ncbi:hypothetical protein CEXT_753111 [Caerostris extrusa]|uniref:Uncharacterized protein n=1 Tax=Caerostris extrusa TaxID=172846 RepID=A0AAV4VC38_CAEEX|nr:hypothetical protein CEXT_753111 [Caerostris extrusa]